MFVRWGQFVVKARWAVLAAGLALVVVGVSWGTGVFGALSSGGFNDPDTAANRVHQQITEQVGNQDADVLALYSSPSATVGDPAFFSAVTGALSRASGRPEVAQMISFYHDHVPALVSTDRHATYAIIRLRSGSDTQKQADYRAISDTLTAG